jgi:hypothetical protein
MGNPYCHFKMSTWRRGETDRGQNSFFVVPLFQLGRGTLNWREQLSWRISKRGGEIVGEVVEEGTPNFERCLLKRWSSIKDLPISLSKVAKWETRPLFKTRL